MCLLSYFLADGVLSLVLRTFNLACDEGGVFEVVGNFRSLFVHIGGDRTLGPGS